LPHRHLRHFSISCFRRRWGLPPTDQWSSVERVARALGVADVSPVLELLAADPARLAGRRIDHHQVRHVDGAELLDDAALRSGRQAAALEVALDDHQAVDAGALLRAIDLEDLAGLALLLAGDDLDHVTLLDVHG